MLSVQSVSMNSFTPKVSFKANKRESFEDDKAFFEEQKREIEGLLDDNRIPKKMKKVLNAANIITDGLIAGFTVACATIASATCGKNTYIRLAKNNMVQSAINGFKPMGEYAGNNFKKLTHYVANAVRKIFGNEIGQKIINTSKKIIKSVKKFFSKLNPFKNVETFDKTTTKAATGLGIGAGAASAYAKTVEQSEQESGEE